MQNFSAINPAVRRPFQKKTHGGLHPPTLTRFKRNENVLGILILAFLLTKIFAEVGQQKLMRHNLQDFSSFCRVCCKLWNILPTTQILSHRYHHRFLSHHTRAYTPTKPPPKFRLLSTNNVPPPPRPPHAADATRRYFPQSHLFSCRDSDIIFVSRDLPPASVPTEMKCTA